MPKTALEHLDQLIEGNTRFAQGSAAIERAELALGQAPFAVVLGCSDSRVPVETVFDRGPGEIFVVRVAGNVVTSETLASIQYAVEVLNTSLVLVLGHSGCGAVGAALDRLRSSASFPGEIDALVDLIVPAAEGHVDDATSDEAVAENVRRATVALGGDALLAKAVQDRRIAIRGAVYDLHSGRVQMLE
ncbi:MAG TPA: carbonic anhydrase [Candidatus Baltobacteraceae bacterium]|nr:carbonic anhydrase [Candidatus Baltobacteraceae bacterium]